MVNNRQELLSELKKYPPQDSDMFIKFRDDIFNNNIEDKIELSAKFAYLQTQIFSGNTLTIKTKITLLNEKYKSKYEHLIDKLERHKYDDRLDSITDIENMEFQDVISKYDSEDTLFYCDPPYYNMEKYYTYSDCDHIQLANILKSIRGKFILSYYDFDSLNDLYPNDKYRWVRREYNSQNGNRKR